MSIQETIQSDIESATYSAEDNKLRLYPACRLDHDLYLRVKEAGFRWAPVQELFVAPSWTPGREDLCIELAGEVVAEDSTLIDRAEAKAERLDNLAAKRLNDSNTFANAASRISERFAYGQPILVGHHSENKARRDHDKIDNAMRNSIEAMRSVSYWNYKAEGVERHANRNANHGVRSRRIKKLLAELRDRQRALNHGSICLDLWQNIADCKDLEKKNRLIEAYCGGGVATGSTGPHGTWSDLNNGKITHDEALEICLNSAWNQANSVYTARWIAHILNRLGYEQSELGEVSRFDEQLTPVILQAFTREQGAHKPHASPLIEGFKVKSTVDLPLHLADCSELILSDNGWRDLMQSCGYSVPAPKKGKAQSPLLNFRADEMVSKPSYSNENTTMKQIEMTKAEYKAIYPDHRYTMKSLDGSYRYRAAFISSKAGLGGFSGSRMAVFLTDSKEHAAP